MTTLTPARSKLIALFLARNIGLSQYWRSIAYRAYCSVKGTVNAEIAVTAARTCAAPPRP